MEKGADRSCTNKIRVGVGEGEGSDHEKDVLLREMWLEGGRANEEEDDEDKGEDANTEEDEDEDGRGGGETEEFGRRLVKRKLI